MAQRPTVFFIIGEHSGDLHASFVARELLARADVALTGVAGPRMEAAGVKPFLRGERWGVMGLVPALLGLPWFLTAAAKVHREIRRLRPDVVVPVDFGAFNVRVLRRAHADVTGKVLYYFPPRSWDRKATDWSGLAPLVDRVATPFPWSADNLNASGIAAEWVGHPVLETLQPAGDRTELRRELGLPTSGSLIGLLAGSRGTERRFIGPALVAAAEHILRQSPDTHFVWSKIDRLQRFDPPGLAALESCGALTRLDGSRDILRAADAAIVTMGTATLEAAAADCPMVAVYSGTLAMRLQFHLTRNKPDFYSMPNLLLQRGLVPEFLATDGSLPPGKLADGAMTLCSNGPARREQLAGLAEVRAALGTGRASARVAEMILELLAGRDSG